MEDVQKKHVDNLEDVRQGTSRRAQHRPSSEHWAKTDPDRIIRSQAKAAILDNHHPAQQGPERLQGWFVENAAFLGSCDRMIIPSESAVGMLKAWSWVTDQSDGQKRKENEIGNMCKEKCTDCFQHAGTVLYLIPLHNR